MKPSAPQNANVRYSSIRSLAIKGRVRSHLRTSVGIVEQLGINEHLCYNYPLKTSLLKSYKVVGLSGLLFMSE